MNLLLLLGGLVVVLTLLYYSRGYLAWAATGVLSIWVWRWDGVDWMIPYQLFLVLFTASLALFGIPSLRLRLVTRNLMPIFARLLPRISDTEKTALEAGSVWWDGELFSGAPDWRQLLDFRIPEMPQRERDFIANQAKELARRIDDWQITQQRDLPKEVWDYIKKEKFFGMIIPPEHGGLGFSAAGNSAVVATIAGRSVAAAVTVMVPNSLGPGELLLHYGTDEQKRHYLPRLARGEEIPCFALTEPYAGSDAASLQSRGVVCRGSYNGQEVLGMRLNWDKRYTTLGPIATVLGLAFQLHDPERLLGGEKELGITCALIPMSTPGIQIGERHDPLGCPFLNGPNYGKDVFVPIDCIIGGAPQAGKGWRMLMDCLTVGRSISLPAVASAEAQLATRVASAYALVREQFNMPIGRFEGIEAPLARIGGLNYALLASRRLTLGAIDSGHKPAVISAIMKAYSTEAGRVVVNDAMDLLGGAGISLGPRNTIGHAYTTLPITVTVEGANILTRTMIIFGQGAIRCHPFVQREIRAVAEGNLLAFDNALFGHINFTATNAARSFVLGLTRGWLATAPTGYKLGGDLRCAIKQLSRYSAAFSMLADIAMGTLGGELKRRERISGRFADALAWLYFGSALVKKYLDDGQRSSDRPLFRWAIEHALYQIQEALRGIIDNFPMRWLRWPLRCLVFPSGAYQRPPQDRWVGETANALLSNAELRDRLTPELYIPPANEPGLGMLEEAWRKSAAAANIEQRLKDAQRSKRLPKLPRAALLDEAVKLAILSASEKQQLEEARQLRLEAVRIDSFDGKAYLQMRS